MLIDSITRINIFYTERLIYTMKTTFRRQRAFQLRSRAAGHSTADVPEKSFFYSIRNLFKQEYHGRYFAILLRELARHEPSSFEALFELLSKRNKRFDFQFLSKELRHGNLEVTKEYEFFRGKTSRRGRFADLALLRQGIPIVLFEIKEFDGKNKGNSDQIAQYINEISNGEAKSSGFVFVSRFAPESNIARQLDDASKTLPVASIRYYELYRLLKERAGRENPLARMICDYMEDIGVTGYRKIDLKNDQKQLIFLLTQLLGFPNRNGMGRWQASDNAVAGAPDLLAKLYGNLEMLGDWLRTANPDLIKVRFRRRFYTEPYFALQKLEKALTDRKKDSEKIAILPGDGMAGYVKGGVVFFDGIGTLSSQKGDWLELGFGYALEVQMGDQQCRLWLYSQFNSRQRLETTYHETPYLNRFPDEAEAEREFSRLISKSVRAAKQHATGHLRKVLDTFRIPDIEAK